MTNEELLLPRFKLISDFMGNSRPVGSVSTEIATANYFRKFPANFKELKWSDERDVKDLPLYLKNPYNGSVHKVIQYALENKKVNHYLNGIYKLDYIMHFMPATESEYLAAQNRTI